MNGLIIIWKIICQNHKKDDILHMVIKLAKQDY